MTTNTTEPALIRSEMCQDVLVEGHRFSITICSATDQPGWTLEVIDENGMSHVWDMTFESDRAALDAAMIAFEDEGAASFLQSSSNIVVFPNKPL